MVIKIIQLIWSNLLPFRQNFLNIINFKINIFIINQVSANG